MHFLCVGVPVDFVCTGSSKITYVISRCDNFNDNKDIQMECGVTCIVEVVVVVVVVVLVVEGGKDDGVYGGAVGGG
jgi:hypothetical protein